MAILGKRILIFGDSLTHHGHDSDPPGAEVTQGSDRSAGPGDLLGSHLLELGAAAVRLDAKVGRSAYNFFRVEDATDLLKADNAWNPDIVIVFLGTNDIGLSMTKDAESMEKIRSSFANSGAEVWAIGPPSFAKASRMDGTKEVVDMLDQVFGSNRVIDARPITTDLISSAYRTSDGVHFKSNGSKLFASRLARSLEEAMHIAVAPVPTENSAPNANALVSYASPWQHFGIGIGFGVLAITLGFGIHWIIKRRQQIA